MWFVIPQLKGLGCTGTAEFYGIESTAETLAYWQHRMLVANQRGDTARSFFSDFICKYAMRWTQPALLREARRAAGERVVTALGGTVTELERGKSLHRTAK